MLFLWFGVACVPDSSSGVALHAWLCRGAARESGRQHKLEEEAAGGFGKDGFSQQHMIMLCKEANEQDFGKL